MRDAYVSLRKEKTGQRSAFQITVRQLESLIRLSEAIARVHFDFIITPSYVKEATRMISNSIIKLERKDVELEEFSDIPSESMLVEKTTTNLIVEKYQRSKVKFFKGTRAQGQKRRGKEEK